VERRFLGPHPLAEVEHPLAHDARAGAPERVLDDLVVFAGLAALAELRRLPEEPLPKEPALELAPLSPPILVGRIAGVLQVHARRREISIEGDADAEEHLAHLNGPFAMYYAYETTGARASHRSMSEEFSSGSLSPRSPRDFEPLVEAARGGDEHAFRALIEPLGRELHAYAYRMLGGFHDADDALQDAQLKAWRALATYEPRASFRAWMYRIVTNTCLDMLKGRSRRVLPQDVGPSTAPGPPTTAPR
jgi:hypothetical protein